LSFFISIFFPPPPLSTCTMALIQICACIRTYKCVHICIHVQHSCTYTYFYQICVCIFPFKNFNCHKKVWWIGVTDMFDGSDESYEDTIIHKKASNL
jgi:hypothetical protein